MCRWILVSFLLLADVGLAESPRIVTLPAQHLACVSGESPSDSILEDGLRMLHTQLIGAEVERTGFPFFLETTALIPGFAGQAPDPGAAEEEALPVATHIAWTFCVPLGPRESGSGELERVETPSSTVVVSSVGDLDKDCAEELEALVAERVGGEREHPPRSIPIFRELGAPVDLSDLAPFLATDALETLELTALAGVAQPETIDKQLAGKNQQLRPLFAAETPQPQPEQVGVTCLLKLTAEEAEILSGPKAVAEDEES